VRFHVDDDQLVSRGVDRLLRDQPAPLLDRLVSLSGRIDIGSNSSRGLRLGIAEEFRGESMSFLPPFPGRDSRTEASGCGKRREAALQNPDGPPTTHRND
jgi:hypothetical protein